MVLQAQATLLIQSANVPKATPGPATPTPAPPSTPIPNPDRQITNATLAPTPGAGAEDESQVQLLGVSLGTESGLIVVQFKAPPELARQWQQLEVYVVDEATGTTYNEIPVAPVIGPLFTRPKQAGQIGYLMLVNTDNSLRQGAQVTVVLGKFNQEHVPVT
jgi:hypothetical protein